MKISVNDVELFTLTETQKNVIKNQIPDEIFEEDMKRRIQWVLMHKYEQCFKELKNEWDTKLAENGLASMPTNADSYAQLVFAQPNYKNRSSRELEASAAMPVAKAMPPKMNSSSAASSYEYSPVLRKNGSRR